MAAREDYSSAPNIQRIPGAPPEGDLIFVSVDRVGSPGRLNSSVLAQLRLDSSFLPREKELLGGYAIKRAGSQQICFVVTVGDEKTADLLEENLQRALSDSRLMDSEKLWIPLMGTGDGRLPGELSERIIIDSLHNASWCMGPNVRITIALPGASAAASAPRPALQPTPTSTQIGADEAKHLPQSSAVAQALAFAAALNEGRTEPRIQVTTSLLFFALAESQVATTPHDLTIDRSAIIFSGAVHYLAGNSYMAGWNLYFSPGFRAVMHAMPDKKIGLTRNMQAILRNAEARARARQQDSIGVDDVVVSLLELANGRYQNIIKAMGLSVTELLEAYVTAKTATVYTALHNDVAATDDHLDYKTYAKAFSDFIRNPDTPVPLSISIQAPWGVGKSSLMRQIRDMLDEPKNRQKNMRKVEDSHQTACELTLGNALDYLNRKRPNYVPKPEPQGTFWTVWFNAWKYDTTEQVWSGLVDAIISEISDRLPPIERELFLFRLQLARIDDGAVRRKIYDRIITFWWNKVRTGLLIALGAIASLFGLWHFAIAPFASSHPWWSAVLSTTPALSPFVLAWYLYREYQKAQRKTEAEPASFSLASYLKVPDYQNTLGTIHHIHDDLLRVLSLAPRVKKEKEEKITPLVIFIDDLDRCSPSKVAGVVEGVNMFLASEEYRCVFVIGMDPQMIAAALEDAHANVRQQLPRFECTVPLGWRFMDKFIQLPFTIPPSDKDQLTSYVDWLAKPLRASDADSEDAADRAHVSGSGMTSDEGTVTNVAPPTDTASKNPVENPIPENVEQRASKKRAHDHAPATDDAVKAKVRFGESRDVGVIIREAVTNTSGNPREMKRVVNLARLYLGLRNARRATNSDWRSPSLSQYARWIKLALRWPDMMRWLQWGADECAWSTDLASRSLQERRLNVLQDEAKDGATPQSWKEAVVRRLNVPGEKTSDWICDSKLFEFFRDEAERPEAERLSAAVAQRFW